MNGNPVYQTQAGDLYLYCSAHSCGCIMMRPRTGNHKIPRLRARCDSVDLRIHQPAQDGLELWRRITYASRTNTSLLLLPSVVGCPLSAGSSATSRLSSRPHLHSPSHVFSTDVYVQVSLRNLG